MAMANKQEQNYGCRVNICASEQGVYAFTGRSLEQPASNEEDLRVTTQLM